jgi:ribonuclease BN (tRNA processing enzyme)
MDAGDGALRDILEIASGSVGMGLDDIASGNAKRFIEGVSGILITHEHFDHISGLFAILNFMAMLNRTTPLHIIVPEGSMMVDHIVELYRSGIEDANSFDIDIIEADPSKEMEVLGWSVETILASHRDVSIGGGVGGKVPAVSYVVTRRDVRILYSGDTSRNLPLLDKAGYCDLAIVEATYCDDGPSPTGVHMTVKDAMEVIETAEAGWIIHRTGASDKMIQDGIVIRQGSMEGKP